VVSMLLLSAMIGCIVIAMKSPDESKIIQPLTTPEPVEEKLEIKEPEMMEEL
jgi:hypothetical protein